MSSVNKVILVGNLGQDPDVKTMSSGDKVVNLSIATSESWKDKSTGEKKERTEWHRVVVFNSNLVNVCENYLKKGSKIYIEGQLETRSWEQDGIKKYTTEVILRPYKSIIAMLDSKNTIQQSEHDQSKANGYQPQPHDDLEDEIPF